MLTCICGKDSGYNMGNLKSYFMTLNMLADSKTGREIYTNYKIDSNIIKHHPITSINHLLEIFKMSDEGRNVSIFLDEFSVYFDAYDNVSKSDGTKLFKNIVRQSRKRNLKFYFTAQSYFDLHKSIRRVINHVLITAKYDISSYGELIKCEDDNCMGPHYIQITKAQVYGLDLFPVEDPIYLPVVDDIFNIYDTNQLIELI